MARPEDIINDPFGPNATYPTADSVVLHARTAGATFDTLRVVAGGSVLQGDGVVAPGLLLGSLVGEPMSPTAGECTIQRGASLSSSLALAASGAMQLTYFRSCRSEPIATIRITTGGTAAAATPTVVRYGVYEIDSTGAGTLVASTANDTALLAAAFTPYSKALSATWNKVAGRLYAFALLVVSGAATPTVYGRIVGGSLPSIAATGVSERMSGHITGQTDLPATFAAGSVSTASAQTYQILAEMY